MMVQGGGPLPSPWRGDDGKCQDSAAGCRGTYTRTAPMTNPPYSHAYPCGQRIAQAHGSRNRPKQLSEQRCLCKPFSNLGLAVGTADAKEANTVGRVCSRDRTLG